MNAIGYVRVSTDRQAEQGASLEAQEAKIRAVATVQGAGLFDVIVDGGESAKSLNRPGLQRLLDLINGGKVESVIVAKLDRLTRSVKDLCGLLELFDKRKAALVSVAESLDTGSAAGRLVITIMGAVSQWEREAIGERVGNIEFGYRLAVDGVHVEPGPAEQAALTTIRSLRSDGHTLRAVAGALNTSVHRTRRGTQWRLESAARDQSGGCEGEGESSMTSPK
jgi:DNA invertase Pin-like site-specific DNA recombinase